MNSEHKSVNTVLVLGAGELGLQVLRAMSHKAKQHNNLKISVLLRANAADAISGPHKARRDELMKLDISVVEGDLQKNNIDELSEIFGAFDTVINCSGFYQWAGNSNKDYKGGIECRYGALLYVAVRR